MLVTALCTALLIGCQARGPDTTQPTQTPTPAPISIREYGAQGTGRVDDRPAIQRALDAGAASGRAVRFPAGTYLLASATAPGDHLLRTHPDQRLQGDGPNGVTIKVGPSTPAYRAVIAAETSSIDIGDWRMSGLTIDQSALAGNLLAIPDMARHPRMAVQLGSHVAGSRVSVTDNAFVDADSVNVVYLYANHVRITGNSFSEIGGVVGAPAHDHSSIYGTITQPEGVLTITGNSFSGKHGSAGARTAIETHGGRQVVTDNTVTGYMRGANVTGVAGARAESIVVQRNKIHDATIGIQVWALKPTDGAAAGDIGTVAITENDIALAPRYWRRAYPKLFPVVVLINTSNTATVSVLSVIANQLNYASDPGGIGQDVPGVVVCRTSAPAGRVGVVQIIDNFIVGSPAPLTDPACRSTGFTARDNSFS